jgi:hypothetical protein
MTTEEKLWFLSLPKEMKLQLLEDSLKEGEFGIFMGITKILLDAPIISGGVSSEEIEIVREKYF